jgi:leucyl-tRNA---protein transferase
MDGGEGMDDALFRFSADSVPFAEFETGPSICPYIPTETASMAYRIIPELSPGAYQELLRRGWRRFGREFFRPNCPRCTKCRSLRIPVDRFRPTRSQRRTMKRNSELHFEVREPTVTAEHVTLYNRFHADMRVRRGWPAQTISAAEYRSVFATGGGGCAREFLYRDGDKLVGVALADLLPEALSSVYFFHDPEYRSRAPGVFSVLTQMEFARRSGLRHQYLGYWISECPSMAYKAQYGPHEILARYCGDEEEPVWEGGFGVRGSGLFDR